MATTTKTIKASGGDYTTLSAWEAGQQKVISAGNIEWADCYSVADTTPCRIDGWTTVATGYIQIQGAASDKTAANTGIWSTQRYNLSVTGDVIAVRVLEEYVNIVDIQIKFTSSSDSYCYAIYCDAASTGILNISNTIIVGVLSGTADQINGIHMAATSVTCNVFNTIVYGFGRTSDCKNIYIEAGVINCYSVTSVGAARAFSRYAGTAVAKNCYASTGYYGTWTLTTCASADTSGSTGLQSKAYNTANFTNVTGGSENFHLPVGSALIDVGTDTSGEGAPLNFTTDIDGVARSGTWDVGADEYVAAAATYIPKVIII